MKAVILAAGVGVRLRSITKTLPKALIPINGRPLIEFSLDNLKNVGIKEVIIIVGYMKDFFKKTLGNEYKGIKIVYFDNDEYEKTESMYSFSKTEGIINDDVLVLDSDILYDGKVLKDLIEHPFENVILATNLSGSGDELFICVDNNKYITNLGKNITNKEEATGEFVGISKLSSKFLNILFSNAKEDYARNELKCLCEHSIFNTSKKNNPVKCLLVEDLIWTEIDNENDLKKAREKIFPKLTIAVKK